MNKSNNGKNITQGRQDKAQQWFQTLQQMICQRFYNWSAKLWINILKYMEKYRIVSVPLMAAAWRRRWNDVFDGSNLFEKVGVNVSTVWGSFASAFQKTIPGAQNDPRFWASGISVVAHMRNPHIPAIHMNTRHIMTTQSWFGGGIDLTPCFPQQQETEVFHKTLQTCCDRHHPDFYLQQKELCDSYFYLPHRQERRGVGGLFYDN